MGEQASSKQSITAGFSSPDNTPKINIINLPHQAMAARPTNRDNNNHNHHEAPIIMERNRIRVDGQTALTNSRDMSQTTTSASELAPAPAAVDSSSSRMMMMENDDKNRRISQQERESTTTIEAEIINAESGSEAETETTASVPQNNSLVPLNERVPETQNTSNTQNSNTTATTATTSNNCQEEEEKSMAIVSETMANVAITPMSSLIATAQHAFPSVSATGGAGTKLMIVPSSSDTAVSNGTNAATTRTATQPIASGMSKKKRSPPPLQLGQTSGRWTRAEHEAFIEGLKIHGREWKKVAVMIPTRTSAQVRSHAQKYFSKMSKKGEEQSVQQQQQQRAAAAAQLHPSQSMSLPASAMDSVASASSYSYDDTSIVTTPSIQRNVERILANPEQAQRDVEDTLQALRERYHQLQQQLQGHHHQQYQGKTTGTTSGSFKSNGGLHHANGNHQDAMGQRDSQLYHKKHQQTSKRRRAKDQDQQQSADPMELTSFANEELIALSVLGATLPNIGSPQHHHAPEPPPPREDGAAAAAAAADSSSCSSQSSSTTSTTKSAKRKRDE